MSAGGASPERLVAATAHPVRARALELLSRPGATLTATALADETGARLPAASYHLRRLYALRVVRVARQRTVRGAVQRHYALARAWQAVPLATVLQVVHDAASQPAGRAVAELVELAPLEPDAHARLTERAQRLLDALSAAAEDDDEGIATVALVAVRGPASQ